VEYLIKRAATTPELRGLWDGPAWKAAGIVDVALFHTRSTDHHPVTRAKALYDDRGLYVLFDVADRYVRCVTTTYNGSVCQDSCVEFFVEPKKDRGYFNFEINCGGTLLLYFIEDATRTAQGFKKYTPVPWEAAQDVRIYHSMPATVPEEIATPVKWQIEYAIPLALFERFLGSLGRLPGQTWRANFYKCADKTSHPHWASWAPIGEPLSFHKPECFAPIRFAGA
jgi:hypothetical protein